MNPLVIAPAAGCVFFPLAGQLQRLTRETVTPNLLQKSVWAGANLPSFYFASDALEQLAEADLSAKKVRRLTTQVGTDRVADRDQIVNEFAAKTLVERTTPKAGITPPEVGVVMVDNGTHQRRDQFAKRDRAGNDPADDPAKKRTADTHWKQESGGLVLSMTSVEHEHDPCPEFPDWLFAADVVHEIAGLAKAAETPADADTASATKTTEKPVSNGESGSDFCWRKIDSFDANSDVDPRDIQPHAIDQQDEVRQRDGFDWSPQVVAREVIATTRTSDVGRQLECRAWETGVTAAARQAFVGDGAHSIWKIHQQHFSQMVGILDLMHGLSYACRAAAVCEEPGLYDRWATAIWQGRVADVLTELAEIQADIGQPPKDAGADDPRQRIDRALTYYTYHQSRMNYPEYRHRGLPITSSLMESTIKQLNQRVKGTEKFWTQATAEAVLQLRADHLSTTRPFTAFWHRHQKTHTGTNRYRAKI